MNWSTVKNLLIAILIAANLFLLYQILMQDRSRSYIDADEVADAISLLATRGLTVPPEGVPLAKFDSPVYESIYSDKYYYEVAEALSGSKSTPAQMLPDGSFSIAMENGDLVQLDSEFDFSIEKAGISDSSAYTDITAEAFVLLSDSGEEIPSSRMKALKRKATDFLTCRASDDSSLSAEIIDGFYDSASGHSLLLARQSISGCRIYSHYAVLVFDDEELLCASGRWYFAPIDASYTAELYDQVNILFTDLKTLRADDDEAETLPAVTAMSACYAVYWNADKTALYFIPAWQIEHSGGAVIVYNAANSTVYSRNE